eukprot:gene26542-32078_t
MSSFTSSDSSSRPVSVSKARDMLKSRSKAGAAPTLAPVLSERPISASSAARDKLKLSASKEGTLARPPPSASTTARDALKRNSATSAAKPLSTIPEAASSTAGSSESLSLLDDISAAFGGASLADNSTPASTRPPSSSINKNVTKQYTAKICFLMDITGSMDPEKNAVMEKIVDIVDASLLAFPQVALQMAFVGYRDVDCSAAQRIEVLQFTADTEAFYEGLLKVTCHGGDDEAEDVLGGMEAALTQLNWSGARIKIVFHIGDSPHHGSIFHDRATGCQDSHPHLVNVPRPHTAILSDYADNHIDYNFALVRNPRGNVTTREMGRVFAEAYNACQSKRSELAVMDLTDFSPDHLLEKVMKGLSSSICSFLAAAGRKR